MQALRDLLQNRPPFGGLQAFPPGPQGSVSLPQLASDRAASPFTARPLYLDLPWGAGVRGVVQAEPEAGAPANGRLQYQFAGLTSDNRWLVLATFPLAVPALPAARRGRLLRERPRPREWSRCRSTSACWTKPSTPPL